MLLSINKTHKKHLDILTTQSDSVISDFCKLTTQFLHNGPNKKRYNTAAQKLEVDVEVIENCIYGLIYFVNLACKNKLNNHDFKDSVLALGFTEEQESILSQFYDSIRGEINTLITSNLIEPHYHDLQWRFEVQLATRSLQEQVTPLVVMEMTLQTPNQEDKTNELKKCIFQTDPTNLVYITNELETALNESRSRYSRKIQKILINIQ